MKFRLSDVANITMGQSPKSEFFNSQEIGMPFLQGIRTFGHLFPKIDTFTTVFNRLAKKDVILFSVRAPVGQLNWAKCDVAIGRGLAAIEPKESITDPNYLYYLLKAMGTSINAKANGTVFTSINKVELNDLPVELPELDQQKFVGKLLRLLDNKIQLHKEINDNLAA